MPSSHRDLFPPADEKKALEQLEKFQREIQSARWKREQASAEFETFVKGLADAPANSSASPSDQQPRPAAAPVVRAAPRPSFKAPIPLVTPQPVQAPPEGRPQPEPPPAVEPAAAESQTTVPAEPSYSQRLQHWRGISLVGGALVVIVLLAIGWWRSVPASSTRGETASTVPPQPSGRAAASSAPAEVAHTAPNAPAASPGAGARAPAAGPAATLMTTRRVWVRVMADGHRLFERELPAGTTVPLDATQAIVIRAGDAGAVRITFADGRAETLGTEGQVVTKRFEVKR